MEERYIEMRDGHRLFVRTWRPDGDVKATLHINHGMAEHSYRYNKFALRLASLGYAVYMQDHRGHGLTKEENEKGWFGLSDGWNTVCQDAWAVDFMIENEYAGYPHLVMGHSMGSFITRCVLIKHPEAFSGAIIMGTGPALGFVGKIGKSIALRDANKYGSRMPDQKMNKLCFGSYNSKIKDPRTDFDWLSRDEKEVDKYIEDPLCGFVCSAQFYADLIDGIEKANDKFRMKVLRKDMPMLIISGDADPVGKYGSGVKKVFNLYKSIGMEEVTLKLIPNARHEVLNELDKEETEKFIIDWLNSVVSE
ncbi:MAG: lysophospholipase [Sphaerochaetaceae bacterium]|nr:lysophospholipase [Sphaerochaetaceae bacterium]